jgi:hypothetical protein
MPLGNWTFRTHRELGVIGDTARAPGIPMELSSSSTAWVTYGSRLLPISVSFSAVACAPWALAAPDVAGASALSRC